MKSDAIFRRRAVKGDTFSIAPRMRLDRDREDGTVLELDDDHAEKEAHHRFALKIVA